MREPPRQGEDRFTAPSPWCARPDLYRSHDEFSPEVEVLEFVGALVRLSKPNSVLVSDAGLGRAVEAIGVALSVNDHGSVTFSAADEDSERATLNRCSYLSRVDREPAKPEDFFEPTFDLVFIDGQDPVAAIRKWRRCMIDDAVLVIHDTSPSGHAAALARAEDVGKIQAAWTFATPRGLTIARVV